MFDVTPVQIIILLVVVLLVFGPRRLPEIGRGMGRGIRNFKQGISGDEQREEPDRRRRG